MTGPIFLDVLEELIDTVVEPPAGLLGPPSPTDRAGTWPHAVSLRAAL
jgi:hypothetical protein